MYNIVPPPITYKIIEHFKMYHIYPIGHSPKWNEEERSSQTDQQWMGVHDPQAQEITPDESNHKYRTK